MIRGISILHLADNGSADRRRETWCKKFIREEQSRFGDLAVRLQLLEMEVLSSIGLS